MDGKGKQSLGIIAFRDPPFLQREEEGEREVIIDLTECGAY